MNTAKATDQAAVPTASSRTVSAATARVRRLTSALGIYGWLVVAVFMIGLTLRLYCLDCHGLWGDEVASIDGARLGIPGMFTERFGWVANQTPWHYLLVWLTVQPVDPTLTSALVRLPSAIAGALSPLVLYGVGCLTFGRAQGLLAAFLLALSPVHLNYSQDLRLYSMMVLLTLCSVFFLLLELRTGAGKWYALFALFTVLNLANAYLVATLVMPTLAPFVAWTLWHTWRHQGSGSKTFRYLIAAIPVVGIAFLLTVIEMMGAARTAPDLSKVAPLGLFTSSLELVTWFTDFGLPQRAGYLVSVVMYLAVLLGIYVAVRQGHAEGALLGALFLYVPAVLLAVFATTSVVFQRYAIYALPFVVLCLGNAVLAPWYRSRSYASSKPLHMLQRAISPVATVLLVSVWLYGSLGYHSPGRHGDLAYRPDFRGAASHLVRSAAPDDLIVFLDDPGLGYTITSYYWNGPPPAPAYDFRDPRLAAARPAGSIHWVVSLEDLTALAALDRPTAGWADIARFERVLVFSQDPDTGGVVRGAERIVGRLSELMPGAQPLGTLQGSLYQLRGEIARATEAYWTAGIYFPVGEDYLRTAEGFDALGLSDKAWREAANSKFWEPARPRVHRWYAEKLSEVGLSDLANIESSIADALEGQR